MQINNNIGYLGKYLDQPLLTAKFSKYMPQILIGGSATYAAVDYFSNTKKHKAAKKEKKKKLLKNTVILGFVAASALAATRGVKIKFGDKILVNIKGLLETPVESEIKQKIKSKVQNFIEQNNPSETIMGILNKATEKPLPFREVKALSEELEKTNRQSFIDELIPLPHEITLKGSMKEIWRLSKLGAIPVIGGIAGGIAADALTEKDCKKCIPDKVKEGMYQYLANIVLCNIGAAGALFAMDTNPVKQFIQKKNINPKAAKATAMVAGITITGIIGGSAISNLISDKCLNPFLNKACGCEKSPNKSHCKGIYNERHPEMLDAALHIDDVATVGILSGFRWIEPALPLMYSVSAYRAGIGYRN